MTADSERKAARSRRRRTPRWPSMADMSCYLPQRHRDTEKAAAFRFSLLAFSPELLAFDTGQQVGFGILPNAKCQMPNASLCLCGELVQIEVANGLAGIGRFLGALESFLKLFLEQVALMLLRLHRLPENGFLTGVLVLHGARRRFQVLEGFGSSLGRMRNHSLGIAVDLQQRTAAGTWNFELERRLSHARILPQAVKTSHDRRRRAFPQSIGI